MIGAALCSAQDYDDDNQGNQGDGESYNGNDADGYNANAPNQYQLNVNSDGSNNNPQNYGSPQSAAGDADGDYEGDDSSAAAAASNIVPSVVRVRRSADAEIPKVAASEPKLRVKRHGKYYIGPVYTYVKTDKHANFKWGVSEI